MRLRLVHALSLLLLSAVMIAVLAMGGLMAWNLGSGFADYIRARDVERLEQFVGLIERRAELAGGLEALRQRRIDLQGLLREFAQIEGVEPGPLPSPGRSGGPLPRGGDGPPRDGSLRDGPPREFNRKGPPREGGPPGGIDSFGARVGIYAVDGSLLQGRPLPEGADDYVERPIRVHGERVGSVRMKPIRRVPDPVEARFLRSQYLGIAAVASALVLLALGGAWWVGKRWVRPLIAVQEATARIAHGAFDTRLSEQRGDEIGDVMRNVNRMAEGLQQLDGSRRRLIADISHELRTPLSVLRGEIEALADGVRPLRHEAVLSLQEEVFRLAALVRDLHLLAMSDMNALPCVFADSDAIEIVQHVVDRFKMRAGSRGLDLSSAPTTVTSLPVHWDSDRIEQLLANLLENSLRYTDAPGRIVIDLKSRSEQVLITLDDSAPGVPPADLTRLFEPLYRADAARSRHKGGSGLGLAICEAIARAHGGHIDTSASTLGGLCVSIQLPHIAADPS